MRVGIVGAGSIGGWIGVTLAQAGHEVSVLARGATLAALRDGPWRLDTGGQIIRAVVRAGADPAELGPQDMLVVALKGPALPDVAPALAPMIAPHTHIVPAMNGVPWWFLLGGGGELGSTPLASVDPGGGIARALPFAQVTGCVVHASVTAPSPGHVVHKVGSRLILGEPDGGVTRLDHVAPVFDAAGFVVERSARIQADIWFKLWGNMTMNPISAITGATADRILDDELVRGFVLRVMAEAQAVGARIGAPIAERGEDRNAVTRKLGAFKTSMLQDVEAGRPIELDQLVGAPLEIARLLGANVPCMETLFGLTRLFAATQGLYGAT